MCDDQMTGNSNGSSVHKSVSGMLAGSITVRRHVRQHTSYANNQAIDLEYKSIETFQWLYSHQGFDALCLLVAITSRLLQVSRISPDLPHR